MGVTYRIRPTDSTDGKERSGTIASYSEFIVLGSVLGMLLPAVRKDLKSAPAQQMEPAGKTLLADFDSLRSGDALDPDSAFDDYAAYLNVLFNAAREQQVSETIPSEVDASSYDPEVKQFLGGVLLSGRQWSKDSLGTLPVYVEYLVASLDNVLSSGGQPAGAQKVLTVARDVLGRLHEGLVGVGDGEVLEFSAKEH